MVRPHLALAALLVLAALAGCAAHARTVPAAAPPPPPPSLLDGFERDPLWTQDAAGDHAEPVCLASEAIEGGTALVVKISAGSRGKAIIRKEVDLDLSAITALSVSARTVAGAPPRLVLAVRGAGGAWLESPPVPLSAGWTHDLAWRPDAAAWRTAAAAVDRLMLVIIPQGGDCTVAIDNLRAEGAWRWRTDPAVLLAVTPPTATAARHQPIELTFGVAWPHERRAAPVAPAGAAERLLRRQVAGGAWITAPDGERWFQAAACLGSAGEDGRTVSRYAVRLAPDRAGVWTLEAGLDAGGGRWVFATPATVAVAAAAANPGPVRIDADRRYLARDGAFFWPLGLNVAWAGDYRPWLDRLRDDGCNSLRVWLCPWSNPLDIAGDLAAVNQDSAAAIDRLLDEALARGLAVQLCLAYHGWFAEDWSRNPFNAANGGPVADAREFWTDAQARAAFRRLLDYAVARWNHHPALLAWELVNEADLAPRWRDQDLVDWHAEMSAHLARIGRRIHPVTTSVHKPGRMRALWRLGDIDLVNVHRYDPVPLRAVAAVAADAVAAGKPGWAAELGRDWRPRGEQADAGGQHLRQALWLSWMQGLAGGSWAWWWDVQVQNAGLTRHHAALGRYLAGEDPRGLGAVPVTATGDGLALAALVARDRAWAYACDPSADPAAGSPVPPERRAALTGLAPGRWLVERWDVAAGAPVERREIAVAEDGRMPLVLPGGIGEAAWKAVRALPLAPAAELP